MEGTKDIKNFTKYPSLSDNDYILGTKTDLGGTDAGITVAGLKRQLSQDVKPEVKNGYWWVMGINTGVLAQGKTPVFRKTSNGLEMKYEGADDASYQLLIPMSDLSFTFDDLTSSQVKVLKLKFSDLTETDKAELKGAPFTYADFTPEQLTDLRLTWNKLTPEQKNELKGDRGYSSYEVWSQQSGNLGQTVEDYLAWLCRPATDAVSAVTEKMAQIEQSANQQIADLTAFGTTTQENEVVRVDAEKERVTAEELRTANETDRMEAEKQRGQAEGVRTDAEIARVTEERKRVSEEQNRISAEAVRVTAEKLREENVLKAVDDANTAKEAANNSAVAAQEVADHPTYVGENFYVYKWNRETKAYDKTDIFVKGDAFSIKKVYSSMSEMEVDLNNPDIKEGHFVLINTNNVEDPDNAQLYIKIHNTETNVYSYEFVVDMSGAIGFTGKTAQFSIGNVSKGDEPAVSLSPDGTDADGNPKYKFNLVLPKGEIGPVGPIGPEGKQGDIGPVGPAGAAFTYDMFTPEQLALLVGPMGPTGLTGPQGPQGLKGEKGDKGDKGDQGVQGIQGIQGAIGPKGDTGAVGAVGAVGPQGTKGDTGAQGPQGLRGENGVSCDWQWSGTSLRIYGASGWSSYVNLIGPQGPKGDVGPQGPIGATGAKGATGATGAQGIQGPKGDKGDKGDKGATGATGSQGPKGDSGVFSGGNVTGAIIISSNVIAEAIQFKRTSGGAAITQGPSSFELTTYSASSNIKFNVGADNKVNIGSNQNYTKIAWTVASDIRAKKVLGTVTDITSVLGLDIIRYTRKDDSTNKVCIGVSAQDLLNVFPEFVAYDSIADFYSVDYAGLGTCVAVLGYKSLYKEIETLKKVITEHGWELPSA